MISDHSQKLIDLGKSSEKITFDNITSVEIQWKEINCTKT